MAIFTGAGVAIVTPMKNTPEMEVNYDKLQELIDWQITEGTDCIVIAGTTGEGATLTMEEHIDVIKAAVEFTKGRVPVVAGTGSNCTRTAIELTKEAEEAGCDGALVVTPYYNKATQDGLVKHYSMIAESTKLPLILYNVPGRTGVNIQPETVYQLASKYENVAGIKDAVGDIAQTARMMNLCDGKIDLYSGEDGLVVPILSLGGVGCISVVSDVAPRDEHEMIMAYLNGDTEKARKMQLKLMPLVGALFAEVNPIPVKKAMNLMGLDVGPLRAPMFEMSPEKTVILEKAMKDYGLLK
ncbi:MAG: 4-hydroxy-tetrahydrodipicolinate synthase [Lachnospiraceae bacterium]|nr:4-hydroxy-tetrahydrodipicolinate synthase [Lachnospiraceae bacterium]MDD6148077.1 4-hydroxy-tetrahydrodipicolinate synthase [Lachnospiraceae bacterium]MDY5703667.1 4-hydroxy-tetrahydrodipicolinate synthase [Lachnospiraceae bacterium]